MRDGGYRWFRILLHMIFTAGVLAVLVLSLPQMMLHLQDEGGAAEGPAVEMVSLNKILEKKTLNQEDYRLIFQQTGLGAPAVESLKNAHGYRRKKIEAFQAANFSQRHIVCTNAGISIRQDRCLPGNGTKVPLAPVEDGDILVSFSSHSLGWRHGHAGIVTDAQKGICLEALTLGCESELKDLDHWRNYSNFAVLRLKGADARKRKAIASYAGQNLQNIPYSLLSGIFKEEEPESDCCSSAQCAYLIWYAFAHFGYDLDADGGRIVTVADLARSPSLEIVQCFHINPEHFAFQLQ
ncbi:hypothetical protein NE619_16120 [Anaerovorax odorimutans]|uniref:CHAP domain-containing protein n=1 Tax=Anaerovorax odorimutans TaxID=109327 RepID=A0ABT1RTV6_9FIRM|nr:hypothetical protein [Anaerovorax odorimutans]MCQ4638261.1 hypothetical protein [Anaerovorax odorimutans]